MKTIQTAIFSSNCVPIFKHLKKYYHMWKTCFMQYWNFQKCWLSNFDLIVIVYLYDFKKTDICIFICRVFQSFFHEGWSKFTQGNLRFQNSVINMMFRKRSEAFEKPQRFKSIAIGCCCNCGFIDVTLLMIILVSEAS
jgi:hypothetical protein